MPGLFMRNCNLQIKFLFSMFLYNNNNEQYLVLYTNQVDIKFQLMQFGNFN